MIQLVDKNGALSLSQKMMKGDDGGYYIPAVDENGNLTWIPSEEDMAAIEGANIKGPRGDTGVYIGSEPPVDEDIAVWVNPEGEATAELATKAYVDDAISAIELTPGPQGPIGETGPQGEPGVPGKDGVDGKDGVNGKDGYTPVKGVDYFDGAPGKDGKDGEPGAQGEQGIQGPQGEPGAPGKDGEDGKDYVLTTEDKTEIAGLVVAALPVYNGEVV